jgi:nucleoside-diphosphate-sugar epimerase
MTPERVVITGAAGFIASHLVDAYLAAGAHVVGIDNFITGDERNLTSARRNPRFAFVEADVVEPWESALATVERSMGGADAVLHMASPASPVDYGEHPLATLRVNSLGTENAARAALAWRATFLFASTSESYGDPLEHPQRETYWGNVNSVGHRSCYDEAKRYGEALVSTMARVENLDARLIRIFNTYGPRMRPNDGRVVPNFISQALAGTPLTVYGHGGQTRSFCYVEDLVAGIRSCVATDIARGRVVNLGNPEEYPIARFAEIISEIAGIPFRVDPRPLPPDDPTRRCPDITAARELLGWEPNVPLREGLRRTISWFRDRLEVSALS